MIKLYGNRISGHSHRVELMLALLDLPFTFVDIDFAKAEHKTPAFLRLNPFGQVPVLDDGGTVLRDSNAINVYLARRYDPEGPWLPRDPAAEAEMLAWFAIAAGPLAGGAAAARVICLFRRDTDPAPMVQTAHRLLAVMDGVLAARPWLASGAAPTLADLALYSYTAAAPEGNVDLGAYAHVRDWITRLEALPRFVPMPQTAVGLRAAA
jgi:glutathione S-transferase